MDLLLYLLSYTIILSLPLLTLSLTHPPNLTDSHSHHHLHKRWDDNGPRTPDEEWSRLICKGSTLLAMMRASDSEAGKMFDPPMDSAASPWTDFPAAYEKWGYSVYRDDWCAMDKSDFGLERALRGLGIGSREGDWECWIAEQGDRRPGQPNINEQTYKIGDRVYRKTGALANIAINKKDGALIFRQRYSPAYASTLRTPPVHPSDLPDLKLASDITFGLYSLHGGTTPLRYIFMWDIRNSVTSSAIRRAIRSKGENNILREYPGLVMGVEDEAALALLGTPNGVGTAYFLVQHKEQLGVRWVGRVRVFRPEIEHEVEAAMVFKLES